MLKTLTTAANYFKHRRHILKQVSKSAWKALRISRPFDAVSGRRFQAWTASPSFVTGNVNSITLLYYTSFLALIIVARKTLLKQFLRQQEDKFDVTSAVLYISVKILNSKTTGLKKNDRQYLREKKSRAQNERKLSNIFLPFLINCVKKKK